MCVCLIVGLICRKSCLRICLVTPLGDVDAAGCRPQLSKNVRHDMIAPAGSEVEAMKLAAKDLFSIPSGPGQTATNAGPMRRGHSMGRER